MTFKQKIKTQTLNRKNHVKQIYITLKSLENKTSKTVSTDQDSKKKRLIIHLFRQAYKNETDG